MDHILKYLILLVILLAPSFNCEEAAVNTLEVKSNDKESVKVEDKIYVPPLSLDDEPFTMRLDLEKLKPFGGATSPEISYHK